MFKPNHLHLLVKGHIKNPPKTESSLNQWFTELVEKVRMAVVAGPTSVYVDEPGNEGITGTVTLATSHASIHVWDKQEPSLFQFDIYSCSDFTPGEVISHIDEFDLVSCEWIFIDRNDDLRIINQGKINKK
jgi:S-adenosylmethionine/arginine decarboxylase-like enzyme